MRSHRALAERWVRLLVALEPGPVQLGAAARELARAEPHEAAHALAVMVARATLDADVSQALESLERALQEGPPADLPEEDRKAIARAARDHDLIEVWSLFVRAPPA